MDEVRQARHRRDGTSDPPPDSVWSVWSRIGTQMVADEEWLQAMTRNVPLVAHALMRCSSGPEFCRFNLAGVVPDVVERRAIMYRVNRWTEGRPDPVGWNPEESFEVVNGAAVLNWLGAEGVTPPATWPKGGR